MPNGNLFEEAKKRVANLGNRQNALSAVDRVPELNRGVFTRAIDEVFPETALEITRELEDFPPDVPFELLTATLPSESRPEMRAAVERLPAPLRFVFEELPAIVGTAAGAFGGGLIGQPVIGAAAGGFSGERIAQKIGFAPESVVRQVTAGAAPAVLPGAARLVRSGARFGQSLPGIRSAVAAVRSQQVISQAGEFGANLLTRAKGTLQRPARVLYRVLKQRGLTLDPSDFAKTGRVLDDLEREAQRIVGTTEGDQILNVIRGVRNRILESGPVDFETVRLNKQILGVTIGKLQRQAGIRLGAAKRIQGAILSDLENIAVTKPATAGTIRLAKAATERAKREFAVEKLENIVARFVKSARGEGGEEAINAAGVLNRLRDLTNPKSASFDRNFSTALGKELPQIIDFFEKANRIVVGSAVGPGSIVVRGRLARAGERIVGGIAGGITGGLLGGPATAGFGALAGARVPEQVTGLLLTTRGRRILEGVIRVGQGTIPDRSLAVISQAAASIASEAGSRVLQAGLEATERMVGP